MRKLTKLTIIQVTFFSCPGEMQGSVISVKRLTALFPFGRQKTA
jgi:hypothetical protein